MQRVPCASNGLNHLGLSALQMDGRELDGRSIKVSSSTAHRPGFSCSFPPSSLPLLVMDKP